MSDEAYPPSMGGKDGHFVVDKSFSSGSSSDATLATCASTVVPTDEILVLSPTKKESPGEKDRDSRMRNVYKWYKLFARPTRETMCCIVDYTRGPDFTREDIDLMPWNTEETAVDEEAMKARKSPKKQAKLYVSLDEDSDHGLSRLPSKSSTTPDAGADTLISESAHKRSSVRRIRRTGLLERMNSEDFLDMDLDNCLQGEEEQIKPNVTRAPLGKSCVGYSKSSLRATGSGRETPAKLNSADFDLVASIHAEDEHKRKREDRRLRREAARKNSAGEEKKTERPQPRDSAIEAAAKKAAAATVVDNSEAARRRRAYSWYSKMAQPNRKDLKRRVKVLGVRDISSNDVDLLPWNFNGTLVSPVKMNAMLRMHTKR